jgi:hypothetical protein
MEVAMNAAVGGDDHLAAMADEVAEMMLARTLPKSRWTHEAHLLACVSLVRRLGAADALEVLRQAIPAYNESTGVANTDTGGYHDTLTVYYVWAVEQLVGNGCDTTAVLRDPLTDRGAALVWWDKPTLFSTIARRQFVAPTLVHGTSAGPVAPRRHPGALSG